MYNHFINVPDGIPILSVSFVGLVIILVTWEVAWKVWAMWKAARLNQSGWFIALFLLNTLGILPILYIYVFSPKKGSKSELSVKQP